VIALELRENSARPARCAAPSVGRGGAAAIPVRFHGGVPRTHFHKVDYAFIGAPSRVFQYQMNPALRFGLRSGTGFPTFSPVSAAIRTADHAAAVASMMSSGGIVPTSSRSSGMVMPATASKRRRSAWPCQDFFE